MSPTEPMKEKVSNENGGHAEAQDEVTYLSLSGDDNFAGETISGENFFFDSSKH